MTLEELQVLITVAVEESGGLDGLGEMAEAWLEVNGIENFIKTMGALGKRAQALMGGASTGSRG